MGHTGRKGSALVVATLLACSLAAGAAAEDDYGKILGLSYSFYEGQMSGKLPSWNRHIYSTGPKGYKKDAHLNDGSPIGKDLSGGFYDAGDYLKCAHPKGWAIANMAFSMLEFKDAYMATGQWDVALRVIKWGTDWLLKAHVKASDDPAGNAFVGQVSDKHDHHYFGRPEHATNPRPIYLADASNPGADLAGEYAAGFASAAALFASVGQKAYADTLFAHAKQAFGFAAAFRSNFKVPSGVFQAYGSYWPEGYIAHLAFASAFMCKYSASYCSDASSWWNTMMSTNNLRYGLGYDWDSTTPGVAAVHIAMNTPGIAGAARAYLEDYILQKWEDRSNKCPQPSYSTVCYTPKGMAYYSDWGTLRNNGNTMFIAAIMGKYGNNAQAHICWARSQMRIITGAETGKSYLIGWGPNQPQHPHHRQSACNIKYSEPCNPFNGGTCCAAESGTGPGGCCDEANFRASHPAQIVLAGAIVGGPDQSDVYPDIREDYQRSEIAVDYNAGFTGAAAGLAYFAAKGKLGACGAGPVSPPSNPPPSNPPPSNPPPSNPPPSNPPPSNPPPSNPPPSNPPPSSGCKTLDAWKQCGGQNACPSPALCKDAAWAGYCCAAGTVCKRDNPWWWMCTPAAKGKKVAKKPKQLGEADEDLAAAAAAAAAAGVDAAAAAIPMADSLELVVPAAAPAGGAVELSATMARGGQPVPGAVVAFVVSANASVDGAEAPVTTLEALTGEDGVARVVLPAGAAPGGSSVVSASTADGRAVGVRGNVVVAADDATIAWE